MLQCPIEEAPKRLPQLIKQAEAGEDIIFTENNYPVAKLTILSRIHPQPQHGSAKGVILHMAPDFDAPLEDFKDYEG